MFPAGWGDFIRAIAVSVAVHVMVLTLSFGDGQTGIIDEKKVNRASGDRQLWVDFRSRRASPDKHAQTVLSAIDLSSKSWRAKKNAVLMPQVVDSQPVTKVLPNGLFDGPWYYPARYLHRHVTVLHPIEPKPPIGTGQVEGRVVIVLRVSSEGAVDSYDIAESEPEGLFDLAVITAFANERFAPGLIAGIPVRGLLQIEVLFEAGAAPHATVRYGEINKTNPGF